MLSSLSSMRRSASGALTSQLMSSVKAEAKTLTRPSIFIAARRYQSSSSSSSSSSPSNNLISFDFDSLATKERPVHAATMDRIDLAHGTFDEENNYFSSLRPFTPPTNVSQESIFNSEQAVHDFFKRIGQNSAQIPRESIMDELEDTNTMQMTSVLRKRKIKMRKHKYKKLRKRTRALRKKLGK
ncbi:hypothetical protein BGZ76_008901 [Entomortierella beljakovae]|nr:hypothetical protein BGZ76_008901 [Entomortierella beljakovae]